MPGTESSKSLIAFIPIELEEFLELFCSFGQVRQAVLTIDDSPSRITGEFAAYLMSRNIDAVFFCVGQRLLEFPKTADLLVRSGFTIGNHSFTHPRFSALTLPECGREIAETERIIEAAYARNGIERRHRSFRFPYGDKGGDNRPAIQEILARHGFAGIRNLSIAYPWYSKHGLDTDRDVFWTFDALDYRLGSKAAPLAMPDLLKHLESTSPASGGVLNGGTSDEIILMHDHESTAALHPRYFEEILERIEGFGIAFRKLSQAR